MLSRLTIAAASTVRRRPTRTLRRLLWGVLALTLLGVGARLALRWVPLPAALLAPPPAAIEFVDRQGRPLRAVSAGEGFNRRVRYEELPRGLTEATLAAEDKRFWQHHGVDWFASARAARDLAWRRRIVSGGSTISQQLIKLAEPRPRTVRTKVLEAAQALRLERSWDKPRILTEYLNRLDYGNLGRGPAEAAQFYFGKPVADLSAAEAAFLAGLPQAPGRLNPVRHFERAKRRQEWVLGQMRQAGYLTDSERRRAVAEPIRLRSPRRAFEAPHFVDLLLSQPGMIERPTDGRPVRTTVDLELNHFAEQALHRQLVRLRAEQVRNGAVVVIENATGEVLGLVGSEDYFAPAAGQVNGAWARRSPGSTLKPFTYLLAFEQGATAASVVADVPVEFPTPTGIFRPVNYDRRCYGPMRYRLALANSLNIAAVKVLDAAGGAEALQRRLQAFGLTTLERPAGYYGLGLTLGNAEVRLLELVNAYAGLARMGEFRPYRWVTRTGQETPAIARRVAEAGAAWLIADILSDNRARTLAFGAESELRFAFRVACKTGTSSDFRDNWAIGYTPEYTVGVWVGNFDGAPMQRVSGVTGAAPILHEVFEFLHERHGTTWYPPPAHLEARAIHPVTGHVLKTPTPTALRESFLMPALPPEESDSDYDRAGRVRLPVEYRDWLAAGDSGLAGQAVVEAVAEPVRLRLIAPLPGSTYFLDPDLPESSRWLTLKADGAPGFHWECGTLELRHEGGKGSARLVEGRHELSLRDPTTGERRSTWIQVKRL